MAFQGPQILEKLPPLESLWQLLVDGQAVARGPFAFDRGSRHRPDKGGEPGYLKGMLSGWEYILSTLGQAVSVELLETLHKRATENVTASFGYGEGPILSGIGQHSSDFSFPLDLDDSANVTREGLKEIFDEMRAYAQNKILPLPYLLYCRHAPGLHYDNYFNERLVFLTDANQAKYEAERNALVDKLLHKDAYGLRIIAQTVDDPLIALLNFEIADYYRKINAAGLAEEQKLEIIIKFIGRLERIHPFSDGNCRTFYLLLQKLLLENSFNAVILSNPNRIDAVSTQELVAEIKAGMKAVNELTTRVDIHISPEDREAYRQLLEEMGLASKLSATKFPQHVSTLSFPQKPGSGPSAPALE